MLLAELMRIKAEGDYAAIKALVDKYGVHFDPARARPGGRALQGAEPADLLGGNRTPDARRPIDPDGDATSIAMIVSARRRPPVSRVRPHVRRRPAADEMTQTRHTSSAICRRRPPHRRIANICSSASTTPPSSSCTPTASRRCRFARRCSSGICTRRRSPAATSSTTSATRTTSRCATCSRRSSRTPAASIATTLDEIAALHEAVLDQHRPVQQPDGAQVRARRARPRRSPPRRTPPRAPARAFPLRRRRDARRSCWRGCSRCSSIPTSIRS